jgi:ABC-type multidrug transport system fused ATPase/permease subunit
MSHIVKVKSKKKEIKQFSTWKEWYQNKKESFNAEFKNISWLARLAFLCKHLLIPGMIFVTLNKSLRLMYSFIHKFEIDALKDHLEAKAVMLPDIAFWLGIALVIAGLVIALFYNKEPRAFINLFDSDKRKNVTFTQLRIMFFGTLQALTAGAWTFAVVHRQALITYASSFCAAHGLLVFEPKEIYCIIVLLLALSYLYQHMSNFFSSRSWIFRDNWNDHNSVMMRRKMISHLVNLDSSFYEDKSVGTISTEMHRGTTQICRAGDALFFEMIPQAIFVIGTSAVLFYMQGWFTMMAFIIIIPSFIWVSHYRNVKYLSEIQKVDNLFTNLGDLEHNCIRNNRVISTYNQGEYETARITRYGGRVIDTTGKLMQRWTDYDQLRDDLVTYAARFFVALMYFKIAAGTMTLGTAFMYIELLWGVIEPLWFISSMFNRMVRNYPTMLDFKGLMDTKPKVTESESAVSVEVRNNTPMIEFRDVSFRYPGKSEDQIENVSFSIDENETVAFVGRSGSGKTTITRLMQRHYDVQSGHILIMGQDIRTLKLDSLRSQFAQVSQDNSIFNGTIHDNIVYGRLDASMAEVEAAAKKAQLYDYIMNLKELEKPGFEYLHLDLDDDEQYYQFLKIANHEDKPFVPDNFFSNVGERGVRLSGGEQQRLSIARAMLKDAPILILDEAASHLDQETEEAVQLAIFEATKNRTSVVIAHRLSTITKAHKIIVMDAGRLVECGTHKELMQYPEGNYSTMFRKQIRALKVG